MKSRNGFTLIELLVAIVLLAIGILAVASLFPLGGRSGQQAQFITRATDLAQQKMEELRNLEYDDADLSGAWPDPQVHPASPETIGVFVRAWEVWEYPVGNAMEDMKKVRVTVNWKYGGEARDVSLSSYMGK